MEPLPRRAAEALSPWEPDIFSLVVYAAIIFAVMGAILFLTSRLGSKTLTPEKAGPYESGILPAGPAGFRYPVPFYLVATFFLIFDVEAAYIFSWAVAFESLGWPGLAQITFFIAVLALSLFYIWKKGGLEWGSTARKS